MKLLTISLNRSGSSTVRQYPLTILGLRFDSIYFEGPCLITIGLVKCNCPLSCFQGVGIDNCP